MPDGEKIRSYRQRAEELRTIARDYGDDEFQRLLVGLAANYEQMAEQLERLPADVRNTRA